MNMAQRVIIDIFDSIYPHKAIHGRMVTRNQKSLCNFTELDNKK